MRFMLIESSEACATLVGFLAARRTALAATTTLTGRLGRSLSGGSSLGFRRRRIRFEDGRLAFHVWLRLILFDFFGGGFRLGLGRLSRRIKFSAQIYQHAVLFGRLQTDDCLILRVIQKFGELLKA